MTKQRDGVLSPMANNYLTWPKYQFAVKWSLQKYGLFATFVKMAEIHAEALSHLPPEEEQALIKAMNDEIIWQHYHRIHEDIN